MMYLVSLQSMDDQSKMSSPVLVLHENILRYIEEYRDKGIIIIKAVDSYDVFSFFTIYGRSI